MTSKPESSSSLQRAKVSGTAFALSNSKIANKEPAAPVILPRKRGGSGMDQKYQEVVDQPHAIQKSDSSHLNRYQPPTAELLVNIQGTQG